MLSKEVLDGEEGQGEEELVVVAKPVAFMVAVKFVVEPGDMEEVICIVWAPVAKSAIVHRSVKYHSQGFWVSV